MPLNEEMLRVEQKPRFSANGTFDFYLKFAMKIPDQLNRR